MLKFIKIQINVHKHCLKKRCIKHNVKSFKNALKYFENQNVFNRKFDFKRILMYF